MTAGLFLLIALFVSLPNSVRGTVVDGERMYEAGRNANIPEQMFLTRFGAQKGNPVFITSNVSLITGNNSNGSLVFAWKATWDNLTTQSESIPCGLISGIHSQNLSNVSGNTIKLVASETDFLYVFIVCCKLRESFSINYQITVVNSYSSYHDLFTYEFPFDRHLILVTYIVFFTLYFALILLHIVFHSKICNKRQTTHLLIGLFTIALVLEVVNVFFGLVHYSVYAFDGSGFIPVFYLKEVMNLLGDWVLILVFMLVAGGWQITTRLVQWKQVTFLIWVIYVIISGIYFVWAVITQSVFPWESSPPIQTWAGIIYLIYRSVLLFYIWYQLWHIYRQEEDKIKLKLYVFFGIVFTLWIWYLPLLVIFLQLSNLVIRQLIIDNVVLTMDFVIKLIFVVILIPKWSNRYFQFHSHIDSLVTITAQLYKKDYSLIRENSKSGIL